MPVRVDHAVINVLTAMDSAVERVRALGFFATERGYHSLGSINHLMMFGSDYLELVGIEAGAAKVREEVAASPIGLNGLVFATDDARALHGRLAARGVPVAAPLEFSRPVLIDGREQLARFTTVRVQADFVCGGRVYYCQHHTPELLWHAPWLQHPNTACGLAEFVVVADDPSEQARRYAMLLDGAEFDAATEASGLAVQLGSCCLRLLNPAQYRARFGAAGCSRASQQPLPGGGCMGALGMHVRSLDALRAQLAHLAQHAHLDAAAGALGSIDDGRSVLLPAQALWDCPLVFVPAPASVL